MAKMTIEGEMKGAELAVSRSRSFMPVTPENVVKSQDRLSDAMVSEDLYNVGEVLVQDDNASYGQTPPTTKVMLSYEGVDITGKYEFTSYDREILEAIASLAMSGNRIITCSQVFRTMCGKSDSRYVAPGQQKKVEESIDKLLFSKITIDASAVLGEGYHMKAEDGSEITAIFSGNMIAAEKIQIQAGGRSVAAYELLSMPVMVRYAQATKCLSFFKMELLDTPINKTDTAIVMQSFLLRRIDKMKKKVGGNVITFEEIYDHAGKASAPRQELIKIRRAVRQVLDYWVETGYISGYTFDKKGKAIYSVTIEL